MKTVALALLASTALFACASSGSDATDSSEAAYSIVDPPRTIALQASAVHVECTNTHGSFAVLTFEDRIFTAHGKDSFEGCVALRNELAARTSPLHGSLTEERGAINRGTIELEIGYWSLESWGNGISAR